MQLRRKYSTAQLSILQFANLEFEMQSFAIRSHLIVEL